MSTPCFKRLIRQQHRVLYQIVADDEKWCPCVNVKNEKERLSPKQKLVPIRLI